MNLFRKILYKGVGLFECDLRLERMVFHYHHFHDSHFVLSNPKVLSSCGRYHYLDL